MNDFDKAYKQHLEELWGKVGFIVNLSQMIEYNLANILAFDEILRESDDRNFMSLLDYNTFATKADNLYNELSKRSFGHGLRQAKAANFFTDDSYKCLQKICEERNYIIHHIFKDDLKLKHIESDPNYYFERLETLIEEMYLANEDLCKIFKQQKAMYKLVW